MHLQTLIDDGSTCPFCHGAWDFYENEGWGYITQWCMNCHETMRQGDDFAILSLGKMRLKFRENWECMEIFADIHIPGVFIPIFDLDFSDKPALIKKLQTMLAFS